MMLHIYSITCLRQVPWCMVKCLGWQGWSCKRAWNVHLHGVDNVAICKYEISICLFAYCYRLHTTKVNWSKWPLSKFSKALLKFNYIKYQIQLVSGNTSQRKLTYKSLFLDTNPGTNRHGPSTFPGNLHICENLLELHQLLSSRSSYSLGFSSPWSNLTPLCLSLLARLHDPLILFGGQLVWLIT